LTEYPVVLPDDDTESYIPTATPSGCWTAIVAAVDAMFYQQYKQLIVKNNGNYCFFYQVRRVLPCESSCQFQREP
jgi:hypothetical protein